MSNQRAYAHLNSLFNSVGYAEYVSSGEKKAHVVVWDGKMDEAKALVKLIPTYKILLFDRQNVALLN